VAVTGRLILDLLNGIINDKGSDSNNKEIER